MVAVVAVQQGRPAVGGNRLAVMAGESIYANVRLRLTANRTYELMPQFGPSTARKG
ncbi:hypothetical protein VAWG002_40610 [Aeromonas veronii]|nr:hypothetical protein VAWG002_40610 [Aeromonas veronii]